MKNVVAAIRVTIFMVFAFFILENITDSGDQWAVIEYPVIWLILALILFLAIVLEVVVAALHRVLFASLDETAKARYVVEEQKRKEAFYGWFENTYKKLQGSKPIAKEQEIVLDHSYDGIRELDNNLPPWWVYMFYATIVFAVVYMLRYHV